MPTTERRALPTNQEYFMAKLALNPEMGDGRDIPRVNKRRAIAH